MRRDNFICPHVYRPSWHAVQYFIIKFSLCTWSTWSTSIICIHSGWILIHQSRCLTVGQSFHHNLFSSISLSSRNVHPRLTVCAYMPHSSCMVLFPKISHTSALCYGLLEANVPWKGLQETSVFKQCARWDILCGFPLTYLNNCEITEAYMLHPPLRLHVDNHSSHK